MKADPTYTVYCGPMWSGKTSAMLREIDRLKRKGKTVVVFKPVIDSRYLNDYVVTHDDNKVEAICAGTGDDVLKYLFEYDGVIDYVAVDEAFMIPGIAESLRFLFMHGVSVIVATLDLSSSLKPFDEVKEMLPYATHVNKLSAVCAVTGNDARYTYRKPSAGTESEIFVGGEDSYEPRCAGAHPAFMSSE